METVSFSPAECARLTALLREGRNDAQAHGHRTGGVTIGVSPDLSVVRLCDDNGAFDYSLGRNTGRAVVVRVGCPDVTTETVAMLAANRGAPRI